MLFATAAAGAALADAWGAAAALGAVAILIKGPFGLLPLFCVVLARRRWQGFAAASGACLPLVLFLMVDPAGGWRSGYLHEQLLASATGARTDGVTQWWFLPRVIAGRFWPGLPFALLGFWQARRDERLRPLAIACGLMVALLCLPQRKWGNHAYVAFPLLASLAGAAAAPLLERLSARTISIGLCCAAALAWIASLAGAGRLLLAPPCAFSTALRQPLDTLRPGEPLLVVTPQLDLLALAELAAERDLLPSPRASLPEPSAIRTAVAREGTAVPPSWMEVARGGGWMLLRAR
jgi:hypothetical protein